LSYADDSDIVTLTRREYEQLLDRLEEAEDATALDRFERRIAAEDFDQATADYLPAEFVRQLLEDEHPIRVWRAHRGMTRGARRRCRSRAELSGRDRDGP
jgi:hypothetical protein